MEEKKKENSLTPCKVRDVIYFQNSSSDELYGWTLGMFSDIEKSRDNVIRKVVIKYRNASEDHDRTTSRSVRSLCKIWSEDDYNLQDNLAEVAKLLRSIDGIDNFTVINTNINVIKDKCLLRDGCCCKSHCTILHSSGAKLRTYQPLEKILHMCDLPDEMKVPDELLEKDAIDEIHEDISLDSLSSFLLNFNIDDPGRC